MESGGGGEEPIEAENLLDDISLQEDTEKTNQLKKDSATKEKQKAEEMGNKAMQGLRKKKSIFDSDDSDEEQTSTRKTKRRSSSDTIQWLQDITK